MPVHALVLIAHWDLNHCLKARYKFGYFGSFSTICKLGTQTPQISISVPGSGKYPVPKIWVRVGYPSECILPIHGCFCEFSVKRVIFKATNAKLMHNYFYGHTVCFCL